MDAYIYLNTYNLDKEVTQNLLKEIEDYYLEYSGDKYGYKLKLDFEKGNTISIHDFIKKIKGVVGRDVILYLVDNLLGFMVL